MQFSPESRRPAADDADVPPVPSRGKGRRATSMEYCVLASFILMVLIASVQAFGFKVGGLFTSNAAATSRIAQPGP